MSITEKLAYIKGLCEGLGLEETTKEGKILLAVVDLLDDVTEAVSGHDADIDQIFDEIDAIDEDLTDVEDALLYDDEEDEEECCHHHGPHHGPHHHEECGCHRHHHDEDEWDDEEWDDEEDEDLTDLYDEENPLYEITCPNCGEVVCMDEDMLFSPDCACPNCGTSFEIELDEEDCDCEECADEDKE